MIRAVFLSSTQDNQEIQSLISEMRNYSTTTPDDDNTIKMLYITPEKFSRSDQLMRLLCGLRDRRLLSRYERPQLDHFIYYFYGLFDIYFNRLS